MDCEKYNEKLFFVEKYGNFAETGFLFRKYQDDFLEWYGPPLLEDLLGLTCYPIGDFREWFLSRVTSPEFIASGWDPEILEEDLDDEIKRIIAFV